MGVLSRFVGISYIEREMPGVRDVIAMAMEDNKMIQDSFHKQIMHHCLAFGEHFLRQPSTL